MAQALAAADASRRAGLDAATLVVSEVFGPTLQGEGPSTGRLCAFIRLGGCNLHCAWCDTAYTWDASRYDLRQELTRQPVTHVLAQVRACAVPLVVISGGEPLLHQGQDGWQALLDGLHRMGVDVEVETNGTQAPTSRTVRHVTRFNVSPKLGHAGDPGHRRLARGPLEEYTHLARRGQAVFKFVARGPGDLAEVAAIVAGYGVPAAAVWVMPCGDTPEQVLAGTRELAGPVVAAGWNLTTRLHTLIWASERGR